jgi:hypothetical protein
MYDWASRPILQIAFWDVKVVKCCSPPYLGCLMTFKLNRLTIYLNKDTHRDDGGLVGAKLGLANESHYWLSVCKRFNKSTYINTFIDTSCLFRGIGDIKMIMDAMEFQSANEFNLRTNKSLAETHKTILSNWHRCQASMKNNIGTLHIPLTWINGLTLSKPTGTINKCNELSPEPLDSLGNWRRSRREAMGKHERKLPHYIYLHFRLTH